MTIIRKLLTSELNKYRDHLLRLSPEDRRLRFSIGMDDEGIAGFIRSMQRSQPHVFVVEDERAGVIAAVQIAVRNGVAELGMSVDAEYRRRGYARDLVRRAILWARNRGLRSVYLSFLDENHSIRRLSADAGMTLKSVAGGEWEATLRLMPPTPLSLIRELTYDLAALGHAGISASLGARPTGGLAAA